MSLYKALELRLPATKITNIFVNHYEPLNRMNGHLLTKSIQENPYLWADVIYRYGRTEDYNFIKRQLMIKRGTSIVETSGAVVLLMCCANPLWTWCGIIAIGSMYHLDSNVFPHIDGLKKCIGQIEKLQNIDRYDRESTRIRE